MNHTTKTSIASSTLALAACVACAAIATPADGQVCSTLTKQVSPLAKGFEHFGYGIDVDGDWAIVGTLDQNGPFDGPVGTAYLYRRQGNTWRHTQTLSDPDGEEFDAFGFSVAIHGDLVVVGSPGRHQTTDGESAAFVYRFDPVLESWEFEMKLATQGTAATFNWGITTAVYDDVVVVGTADVINFENLAVAQVFRRDPTSGTWQFEDQLTFSEPGIGWLWEPANWLRLDNDMLIGGEGGQSGTPNGITFLYRFDGANWVDESTLLSPAGDPLDFFGIATGVKGGTAIVGASADSQTGSTVGAAHIYRDIGGIWQLEQTLTPPAGIEVSGFGLSVAVDGPNALVRGVLSEDGVPTEGAIFHYAFESGTGLWTHHDTYVGDPLHRDLWFGWKVSMSGNHAVIASPFDDEFADTAGAVYFIRGLACPQYSRGDSNADGKVGIEDFLAVLRSWGPCNGDCPADADGDGVVGIEEFLNVLSNWDS